MGRQADSPGLERNDVIAKTFVADKKQAYDERDEKQDAELDACANALRVALHLVAHHTAGAGSPSESSKKVRTLCTGWARTTLSCSAMARWAASLAPSSSSA